MPTKVVSNQILNSYRWAGFLESTAIGLRLNLILFIPNDEGFQLMVPQICPVCNRKFPAIENFGMDLSIEAGRIEPEGLVLNSGNVLFPLRDGLMMLVRDCSCKPTGFWPLVERGQVARRLIICFQTTLLDGINNSQTVIELSVFRQVNQFIVTLFHGDSEATRRALDLIISALVIILDAESSWLRYQGQGKSHTIIKGDPAKALLYLEKTEGGLSYPGVFTVPLIHQTFQGYLGVALPTDEHDVQSLLSLMAEHCLFVLEISHLFQLVQAQSIRILNAINYAVLMTDINGNIVYFNQIAGDLLGEKSLNWLNSEVGRISAPWNWYLVKKTSQPVQRYKELFQYGDNKMFIDWQILPLKEGERVFGWLVLVSDRTDYYYWQEIGHRAESFSTITAAIGPLAHELRNPLTGAKGLLQLACRHKEPEKRTGYIELVLHEIDRMSVLVNEFLRLGRSVNTNYELVNLNDLIRELTPLFEGETLGTGIEIIFDLKPVPLIKADPSQITQVLINLIRNAKEAVADHQGYISIKLQHTEEWIEIIVQDNGLGLSPEAVKKLFQPFFTTKERGTGLGLALVKAIIDNHQGKIFVTNLTDGGTTFTIQFPVYLTNQSSVQVFDILLCLSDESVFYPMEQVLQAAGFSAASIEPSELGADLGLKYKPEIILTDQCLGLEKQEMLELFWPGVYGFFIGEPVEFITGDRWKVIPLPLDYGQLVKEIAGLLKMGN